MLLVDGHLLAHVRATDWPSIRARMHRFAALLNKTVSRSEITSFRVLAWSASTASYRLIGDRGDAQSAQLHINAGLKDKGSFSIPAGRRRGRRGGGGVRHGWGSAGGTRASTPASAYKATASGGLGLACTACVVADGSQGAARVALAGHLTDRWLAGRLAAWRHRRDRVRGGRSGTARWPVQPARDDGKCPRRRRGTAAPPPSGGGPPHAPPNYGPTCAGAVSYQQHPSQRW